MSKKGENIYKRKDGRWEARYIKGRDPDGSARYGYCYAKTYRDVKNKLISAKINAVTSSDENILSRTLSSVCAEYLTVKGTGVKYSTSVKYRSIVRNHIAPALGGFKMRELTPLVIGGFACFLTNEKNLSGKTSSDILTLLKSVLKYASERDPSFRPVKINYPKCERREMRVLSREEQTFFINYLMNNPDLYKFGVLLAMSTGLRIGELCALKWGDVSLASKCVRVSSSMQRISTPDGGRKTRVEITNPKTENSYRIIPLTDFALSLCMQNAVNDPSAFVLSGRSDKFVEPRTLQYRFSKYVLDCGLDGVHFHSLRHTFATRCAEAGFDIKSLSEILGHANVKITLERYVHSSEELKRTNMDKLSLLPFAM